MAHTVRRRKLVSVYSAGSVAILFELTDETVYQSVQKYFQGLQERKIKVKALGFANNKLVSNQFLPVLSVDFLNRKNLDWFGIPRAAMVRDFIDTEFDICINLAPESLFPLQYVAGMSKSKLKAGTYNQNNPEEPGNLMPAIYDILIKSEPPHNQVECLKNIHDYLMMLNPHENAR